VYLLPPLPGNLRIISINKEEVCHHYQILLHPRTITRRMTTTQRSRSKSCVLKVLFAWTTLAATCAAAVDLEDGFFATLSDNSNNDLLLVKSTSSDSAVSPSLRGGTVDPFNHGGLDLPPIPPFHPHHTGKIHYSSVMDTDGSVTYRREIQAPCDYGMLVFNIGPSMDNLPYHYDVYGDAYLWSDNGGLCILYPDYTGYQVSSNGPFWRPGYDPTTVKFRDLVPNPGHMHRISSRILRPPTGASKHSDTINRNKAGDYIIMGHHNFYGINFYKQLKDYVNSWGPNGPGASDTNDFGFMVFDATATA